MRRVNLQAAFLGEGGEGDLGEEEGLALAVRGGEIILVVPASTTDQQAVSKASIVRGSLRLETGRVFQFEIHDGAVGAFFEDEPGELFDRREAAPADGLSSLSAGSGRRESFGGAAALKGATATARDVMTTEVIGAQQDQTVDEVARLLSFHHVSGLPVCGPNRRVVGVVSEADLIGKQGIRVEEVMTSPAITVSENTHLDEVANVLTSKHIRRVPVMDAAGQLVGVVSRSDVLHWAASQVSEGRQEA